MRSSKFTQKVPLFSLTSFFVFFFCFAFLYTPNVHAADFAGTLKSVSITDSGGTNQPPVAVTSYSKSGDTYTFDASKSSDPDGNIVEYKWDFGDGATASGPNVNHQYTSNGNFSVDLTMVDNAGGAVVTHVADIGLAAFELWVNFQPASAPVPTGFQVDSGGSFDSARGYGWVVAPGTDGTRDRNSDLSPDQSYDTLIHVNPTGVWEAAVPNGKYQVTVTVGDPTSPDTVQGLQVEGISVINAEPLSTATRWITRDTMANVADGRLTLTFQTATKTKLCWVKIISQ